jgi:hypothetical protein
MADALSQRLRELQSVWESFRLLEAGEEPSAGAEETLPPSQPRSRDHRLVRQRAALEEARVGAAEDAVRKLTESFRRRPPLPPPARASGEPAVVLRKARDVLHGQAKALRRVAAARAIASVLFGPCATPDTVPNPVIGHLLSSSVRPDLAAVLSPTTAVEGLISSSATVRSTPLLPPSTMALFSIAKAVDAATACLGVSLPFPLRSEAGQVHLLHHGLDLSVSLWPPSPRIETAGRGAGKVQSVDDVPTEADPHARWRCCLAWLDANCKHLLGEMLSGLVVSETLPPSEPAANPFETEPWLKASTIVVGSAPPDSRGIHTQCFLRVWPGVLLAESLPVLESVEEGLGPALHALRSHLCAQKGVYRVWSARYLMTDGVWDPEWLAQAHRLASASVEERSLAALRVIAKLSPDLVKIA